MALGYVKTGSMVGVTLSDGTGTPLTLALDSDKGTYTLDALKPGLRNHQVIQRKGQAVCIVFTDRTFPTFQLDFWFDNFSKAAGGTILDFIFKDGAYSARIGTMNPSGSTDLKIPFACDVAIAVEGTDYGDSADGLLTFDDWVITAVSWSATPDDGITISVQGEIIGAFADDIAIAVAT